MRLIVQWLAHRRLVKAQKAARREACQRLAAEVERRANSPEIISFRVRREAALRHEPRKWA